tara:strand:- start:1295 stop:2188 length:894 start_codon:yes stop_codon:yes gene_type:complete
MCAITNTEKASSKVLLVNSVEQSALKNNTTQSWVSVSPTPDGLTNVYDNKKLLISARDISVILGINPFVKRSSLLMEKLNGKKVPVKFTEDIKRGIRLEYVALDTFANNLGLKCYPFDINSEEGNLVCGRTGCSQQKIFKGKCKKINFDNFILSGCPDGIIYPDNVIVEIKCPKKFSKKIPVYYYTQIQIYMYLFNSSSAYYVEYIQNPIDITNREEVFQGERTPYGVEPTEFRTDTTEDTNLTYTEGVVSSELGVGMTNVIKLDYNESFIRSIKCHIDLFVLEYNYMLQNNRLELS